MQQKSGLKYLAELDELNPKERSSEAWIIATDPEYVVKGLTEWLPTWRACSDYSSKDLGNLSNEKYGVRLEAPNR